METWCEGSLALSPALTLRGATLGEKVAVTLVSAQSLRTCLLAIEVASVCLEALHDSNAALQVGEEMVEASGGRDERERCGVTALIAASHQHYTSYCSTYQRTPSHVRSG
jgi:hypothetical protein